MWQQLEACLERVQRLTAIAAVALLTAACETPEAHEPARRPRAKQAAQSVDFRFREPSCDEDSALPSLPGVLTSNGRDLLAIGTMSDQPATIQELGEGDPLDIQDPRAASRGSARFVRLAFNDKQHTLVVHGIRSKLPFALGDKVLYSASWEGVAWNLPEFTITLRDEDGELLLQYGHVGDLEALELPAGFSVDVSQEICLIKRLCGGSIRTASFQDESGESTQIEPGQARSFSGFDIYLYGALVVPEGDLSWRGFDCGGNRIDLLLLRQLREHR